MFRPEHFRIRKNVPDSVNVPPLHERAHFWFDFKWFFRGLQRSMSSPINRQVFCYCPFTYPTRIRKVTQPDTMVNAAQLLLRQQFPELSGLQDVSLGQTMAFNVCAGEFVQFFCLIIYSFSPIQSGTYDCGHCLDHINGLWSRSLSDQSSMRRHLYQCFVKRRMAPPKFSALGSKKQGRKMYTVNARTEGCSYDRIY